MKKSRLKVAGLLMLAMLLGGNTTASAQNFDLNGDGIVNVADMSALINYMSGNEQGEEPTVSEKNENREQKLSESFTGVDLKLPSGTIWADKNLGYSKDANFGMYFAWGEFRGTSAKGQNVSNGYVLDRNDTYDNKKTRFDWAQYEWMYNGESSWQQISKYQIEDGAGEAEWYDDFGTFIGDNRGVLEDMDDAAWMSTGGKWRMPTVDEFLELLDTTYVTSSWVKQGNVWGCLFTSRQNGQKLFLPAAGSIEYQYLEYREAQNNYQFSRGKYWTKELDAHLGHSSSTAAALSVNRKFGIEDVTDNSIIFYERQFGLSIRPVRNN